MSNYKIQKKNFQKRLKESDTLLNWIALTLEDYPEGMTAKFILNELKEDQPYGITLSLWKTPRTISYTLYNKGNQYGIGWKRGQSEESESWHTKWGLLKNNFPLKSKSRKESHIEISKQADLCYNFLKENPNENYTIHDIFTKLSLSCLHLSKVSFILSSKEGIGFLQKNVRWYYYKEN